MTTFSRWRYSLPILVLWLAYGLRLAKIDFQSIWWDEGHSIFVASHPVTQIPSLPAMDVHPPAYFALLNGWMAAAGNSEFSVRYLSVVFSVLTVALLWRFSAALLPGGSKVMPAVAALMAALSPIYVAFAQEVRGYAMITFFATASTFILWQIIFSKKNKPVDAGRLAVIFYILSTAACLYTHYFTIFLLLFQNLVWLVWTIYHCPTPPGSDKLSITKKLKVWLFSQVGILLLFTPQLLLALQQITGYANPNLIPPSLGHFISRSWQAYTVGLTIDPAPAGWAMWSILAALLISWLLLFIQLPKLSSPKVQRFVIGNFLFLLAWFIIPLTAYFIVLQRRPSFEPRYLMLVTPAIFLLSALGLGRLLKPAKQTTLAIRVTSFALLLLFFGSLTTGLYHYYTNPAFFKDDSAGVANWLATETTANDIVYVDVPHPFHYYAQRQQIAAPTHYLFVDIHTAANTLNQHAAGRDRLFWITWWGSDTDPRGVIRFLAEKAGRPAGQHNFKGYHIEWYTLPPTAKFSLPAKLTPTNAIFGDVLRLDGTAFGGPTSPGTPVWATLHFTLLHQTDTNYKVSLRVRGEDGQLVGQTDQDLLNDRHLHTSNWTLVDAALNQATNVYLIPLPPDAPAGVYQLEAVVYNAAPPYPSEGVTGHQTPDGVAAALGQITVAP